MEKVMGYSWRWMNCECGDMIIFPGENLLARCPKCGKVLTYKTMTEDDVKFIQKMVARYQRAEKDLKEKREILKSWGI